MKFVVLAIFALTPTTAVFAQDTEVVYSMSQGKLIEIPTGSQPTIGTIDVPVVDESRDSSGPTELVYSRGDGAFKIIPKDSQPIIGETSRLNPEAARKSEYIDQNGQRYESTTGNQWRRNDGVICSGEANAIRCP